MVKFVLFRISFYLVLMFGILTSLVSNSAGQSFGHFETTLKLEEKSQYYHSLAITDTSRWAIGRATEMGLSTDEAMQICTEKNAPDNCQLEVVAPINTCLAVAESVDPHSGNESYLYYWEVEDSLENTIQKTLETCGEESDKCAIALVTCGTNTQLTNRFLKLKTQTMLSALGFNPGLIDGKIGLLTQKALKKFRQENDLPLQDNLDINTYISLTSSFYNQFPMSRVRYALMKSARERITSLNKQQSEQIFTLTTSPSPANNECSNNFTFAPAEPTDNYGGWGVWIHDAQLVQWVGPECWSQEESRELAIKGYGGQPRVTDLGGCPANTLCMTFAYPNDVSWAWIGCGKTAEEARRAAITVCESKHGCNCITYEPGKQDLKSGDPEWMMCLTPQQLAMGRDCFENSPDKF